MKSEYSKIFVSKTIFKGHILIFFMLIDTISGKVALKRHDLYQIVLTSLNNACDSFMGEKLKGVFSHKLINDAFFKYKYILDIDLCLEKKHFYKRDHNELKNCEKEMSNYNVMENLLKYAKMIQILH